MIGPVRSDVRRPRASKRAPRRNLAQSIARPESARGGYRRPAAVVTWGSRRCPQHTYPGASPKQPLTFVRVSLKHVAARYACITPAQSTLEQTVAILISSPSAAGRMPSGSFKKLGDPEVRAGCPLLWNAGWRSRIEGPARCEVVTLTLETTRLCGTPLPGIEDVYRGRTQKFQPA